MYLILNKEHFTFHLQYTHSGTFVNRKYEELSYFKNQKMCDPILVIMLKMRPHGSQSCRENATSGTFPLASYKEEPPSPHRKHCAIHIFLPVKIKDMMLMLKVVFSACK